MNTEMLEYWIRERHSVYQNKNAGLPKPWSRDPVFQTTRFCNVYRELDTVSRWLDNNWYAPRQAHADLWFAALAGRLFNLPAALATITAPTAYGPRYTAPLKARRAAGAGVFNSAYIVSTNGHAMPKIEYLDEYVLAPAWERRMELRPKMGQTLADYHRLLLSVNGLASFMAGQVVADLKFYGPLNQASDWDTFAVPGPGSKKGLNIVMGREPESSWKLADWFREFRILHKRVTTDINDMPYITGQNLQNCLCELSKFHRIKSGTGRAKNSYPGVK